MDLYKIDEIALVLAKEKDTAKIEAFLESILTPRELKDLSNRWELVKLLDKGLTQRAVASKLKLSLCKITRGSKELKKKNSVFKEMIKKFYKLSK